MPIYQLSQQPYEDNILCKLLSQFLLEGHCTIWMKEILEATNANVCNPFYCKPSLFEYKSNYFLK